MNLLQITLERPLEKPELALSKLDKQTLDKSLTSVR